MLDDIGYQHGRAGSRRAALEIFRVASVCDAVLSDMVMPGGMDGLPLAAALTEASPELPIVLVTGYSAAATAAGSRFPLLLKPYAIRDLEKALLAVLRP